MRYICAKLPCRVGGGVRSATRALELIDAGATHVIVGSSLYRGARAGDPPDQYLNLAFAQELVRAVGNKRIIGAVDSKGGQVVIHGWKTALPITAVQAVKALESLLRRVPLHARRSRGAHAGHRHGRDPRRWRGRPRGR